MRVTTRLISALVATGLVIVSLVTIIELILAAAGRTPWLVDWRSVETFGQEHSWDDAAVRLIGLLCFALATCALVAALRPRPPIVLATELGTADVTIDIRRRSLELMLERRLTGIDGVVTASCRWDRTAIAVRATTSRWSPGDLDDRIEARVLDLVRRMGLSVTEVRVAVRSLTADGVDRRPPPPESSTHAEGATSQDIDPADLSPTGVS